jgi:hypothetical protein
MDEMPLISVVMTDARMNEHGSDCGPGQVLHQGETVSIRYRNSA